MFVFQDREVCQRELLELCSSQQTDLDTALSLLQFVRQYSSLRAETAQVIKKNLKNATPPSDTQRNLSLILNDVPAMVSAKGNVFKPTMKIH